MSKSVDMTLATPGHVHDNVSADWFIKPLSASACPHREFDWCNLMHSSCCFKYCPIKLPDTFKVTQEQN